MIKNNLFRLLMTVLIVGITPNIIHASEKKTAKRAAKQAKQQKPQGLESQNNSSDGQGQVEAMKMPDILNPEILRKRLTAESIEGIRELLHDVSLGLQFAKIVGADGAVVEKAEKELGISTKIVDDYGAELNALRRVSVVAKLKAAGYTKRLPPTAPQIAAQTAPATTTQSNGSSSASSSTSSSSSASSYAKASVDTPADTSAKSKDDVARIEN